MPLEFPSAALSGSGPSVQVIDTGGLPNTIIDTDDQFTIRVRWSVNQPGASLLGGQWLVRAYAESIGPGQETELGQNPPVTVSVGAGTPGVGPARLDYTANVVVPPNSLDAEGPNSSGVYKLVAIVTHQNFGQPTVLAGFSEGDVIQMRNP